MRPAANIRELERATSAGCQAQIIHDEKPRLELFQEVIVYGTTKRVSFRPRPDFRLIVATLAFAIRRAAAAVHDTIRRVAPRLDGVLRSALTCRTACRPLTRLR